MEMLFIGGIYHQPNVILSNKKNFQYAADAFQKNLIKGFNNLENIELSLLNCVFIGSFPMGHNHLFIRKSKLSSKDGIEIQDVGFLNLPLVKHISRYINMSRAIKDWALKEGENKVIVCYSLHTPFLKALSKAKQINPSIKTCVIVPDLPQYMRLSDKTDLIYSLLKKLDQKLLKLHLKYSDYYVFLTERMKDFFENASQNYIIMEGIVNKDDLPEISDERNGGSNNNIKSVVYTGTLNKKYGIVTLLEAFMNIEHKNYKLTICGEGDAEIELINAMKQDNRIEYLGNLSRSESLKVQRTSTVLVNPRSNEGEFTKYSFPSKNLEYMLSGRPIIAYKLDGIPDEYDDYIYYIDGDSIDAVKNKLVEVCEKSEKELNLHGKKAQEFACQNKNHIIQTKRIINLIKNS